MKHVHYTEVELEEPPEEDIKDLKVRWLISKKDGAKRFAMRVFEIQPGGYTPLHQHDWEHEAFVLEGSGVTREKTMRKHLNKVMCFLFRQWNGISLLIIARRC